MSESEANISVVVVVVRRGLEEEQLLLVPGITPPPTNLDNYVVVQVREWR